MTPEIQTNKVRKHRDRPFPWPCANCLKDEVYPVTMPYTTDVKHDGRMYQLTIPALTIPKCRACGELTFSNSVDDQIVQALRTEVRLLTPQQIRDGREALGLQSKDLAERLGVAKETLSRWETGMMIQSRAMDNLLRVYFAVPEVRAVLRGAEQDAALGTLGVTNGEADRSTIPLELAASRHFQRCLIDHDTFVVRLRKDLDSGLVLENPGRGTSTVVWCDGKRICYKRGRARLYIDLCHLHMAYLLLFSKRQVTTSDLKKLAPGIYDSSQNGHNCNCTFFFMALRQMGVIDKVWGAGKSGDPFSVRLLPG